MDDKGWQPISVWCAENLPTRSDPLRAGEPVGPWRLEAMFGAKRKDREIEVRAREKMLADPKLLPAGEWFRYLVQEGEERLVHVETGTVLYGAEVRTMKRIEVPAPSTPPDEQHGPRGFGRFDELLAAELIKRVDAGEFVSDYDAALQNAERIKGHGGQE